MKAFSTPPRLPQAVDDWRAVIDDPEIDAIVIGTWPNMHATLTKEALRAGKHVLCEARMVSHSLWLLFVTDCKQCGWFPSRFGPWRLARGGKCLRRIAQPCLCNQHVFVLQARNVAEAQGMLAESQRHPKLVAQIVPSPYTLPYDRTICELIR